MKISLKLKSIIAMLLFAALLSAIAILISYHSYSSTMNEHYKASAMNIARTAASQMDGDKIREYIAKVESLDQEGPDYKKQIQSIKDDDYDRMLDVLFDIKKSNRALYLYVETVSAQKVVYIMDADEEGSACELGDTYPPAENSLKYLDSLEEGVPGFITNSEEFGWLCTAGAPIFDRDGKVVALAFTDVSMDAIMADRHDFLLFICVILIVAAALATVIIIIFIQRYVVIPINALSLAASQFVSDKNDNQMEIIKESAISRLKIHTGDEIQKLSEAVKTMERDINNYIENLTLITAEKERIGAELNVATQIQASMLPCIFPAFPEREEFDIYATMQPAKEVGGDFYDFFLIDQDHLAVVIADVSGKGVPAALFMVIAKTLIKNQTQAGLAPAEVFTAVNTQLCENNEAGMFVTGWMGVLEISTGSFTYVNAGHNPPLLKKKGGNYEYLRSRAGFVLAGMDGMKYKQFELKLEPGDGLYLYTDGVTEATNAGNELYGESRLNEVLGRNREAVPAELLPAVARDIEAFVKDVPQFDDITMLALIIREKFESKEHFLTPYRSSITSEACDMQGCKYEMPQCGGTELP